MQDYVNRLLLAINRYDPNDVQTVNHLRDLVCWISDNDSLKKDQLLHRVKKLEDIISILKTVNCTFRAPLKEKLAELELLSMDSMMFIHFVRFWMFLVAPFITISFAINVVTHGLRSAGMNTAF